MARGPMSLCYSPEPKDAPRGEGITLFLIEQGDARLLRWQIRHAGPYREPVAEPCSTIAGCRVHVFLASQGGSIRRSASPKPGQPMAPDASVALRSITRLIICRRGNSLVNRSHRSRLSGSGPPNFTKISRTSAYHACALADAGTDDAPVAASMAKLFGSEVSTKVTEQCIQFLGGHGLDKDHPVERFYRETKLFQVGDGSSEMLSLLISRHLNKQAQAGMHARLASD